eukprot:scaffold321613_cov32-Tisochrysis_lutea.AAC.1
MGLLPCSLLRLPLPLLLPVLLVLNCAALDRALRSGCGTPEPHVALPLRRWHAQDLVQSQLHCAKRLDILVHYAFTSELHTELVDAYIVTVRDCESGGDGVVGGAELCLLVAVLEGDHADALGCILANTAETGMHNLVDALDDLLRDPRLHLLVEIGAVIVLTRFVRRSVGLGEVVQAARAQLAREEAGAAVDVRHVVHHFLQALDRDVFERNVGVLRLGFPCCHTAQSSGRGTLI